MTSFRKLGLISLASLLIASTASADEALPRRVDMPLVRHTDLQPSDSILSDVYVKLYLARLRGARLAVERLKQELSMVVKRRDRGEALYRRNAMAAEELEDLRKQVEVAAIRVQEAESDVEEAATFVDIAVSRISIGLEMPICAEIR